MDLRDRIVGGIRTVLMISCRTRAEVDRGKAHGRTWITCVRRAVPRLLLTLKDGTH